MACFKATKNVEDVEIASLFPFSKFDHQLKEFIGTKTKSFLIFSSAILEISFWQI